MYKILFVISLISFQTFAAKPFCKNRPIKIAFYEFGNFYSNGEGFDKDIIDELKKRSGCEFSESVRPRARIWSDIEDGALDLTVSGIQNEERDKFAYFIPYVGQKNHLLINETHAQEINSLERFMENKKLTIGVVRSFKHGVFFDNFVETLKKDKRVLTVAKSDQLLEMLVNNRIAATMQLPLYYTSKIKNGEYNKHKIKVMNWDPSSATIPHCLVLSKKNFSLEEFHYWDSLIKDIRSDKTLERFLSKYLSSGELSEALNF